MTAGADEVMNTLRAELAPRGFDLLQPFRVGRYNDGVEPALRLEDWGSSDNLAVIVGNTRALWPVWLDALASDAELAAAPDPLDAYTERCVSRAVGALGVPAAVRFAHEVGERCVAMQRLAHVAGLAYLTETHLSVHPTYGPWIALRAAVTLPLPGPFGAEPALAHPCGGCEHGCRPAFERALGALAGPPSEASVRASWQLWADFRGACPIGRDHRYPEAMLRYHYTKDRRALEPRRREPTNTAQRNR